MHRAQVAALLKSRFSINKSAPLLNFSRLLLLDCHNASGRVATRERFSPSRQYFSTDMAAAPASASAASYTTYTVPTIVEGRLQSPPESIALTGAEEELFKLLLRAAARQPP